MLVDSTTLSDLEVFRSLDGSRGLLHLLDWTATSRGHAALIRRFREPSHDIDAIRSTQDAVRFFQRHPDVLPLDEEMLIAVGRYLDSNISINETSKLGARAEHLWMKVRYRDLTIELKLGVDATRELFARVSGICSRLRALDAPSVISSIVGQLATTADAILDLYKHSAALLRTDAALRHHWRAAIDEALDHLGELDALNAMAAATNSCGWVLPDLEESETFQLEAEGLFQPFVDRAVKNPARLTGGEPMIFLTGPNMAGKTTYLRSVALLVLLGQVGMGVPAQKVRFTPVEVLFTSLNPTDNLRAGLSYFLAEVLRVKVAAGFLAEGRRALVLFDEVFKGTNVRDALDASAEVILGFAKARRSGFIFSSHLVELVEALEINRNIRFYYFDGDISEGVPQYTYKLREGVSDKRFGLLLLRQAQVPELIARISA
jgi:DNA mismatch repair ATPase MutS